MGGAARYDGLADWYDREFATGPLAVVPLEAAARLLGSGPGRLLDVGCGTGSHTAERAAPPPGRVPPDVPGRRVRRRAGRGAGVRTPRVPVHAGRPLPLRSKLAPAHTKRPRRDWHEVATHPCRLARYPRYPRGRVGARDG